MREFGLGASAKLRVLIDHERIIEPLEMQLLFGDFASTVLAPQLEVIRLVGIEELRDGVIQFIEMIVLVQVLQRILCGMGPITDCIVPIHQYGFILTHFGCKSTKKFVHIKKKY